MKLIWLELEHVATVAYGADLSAQLYQGEKPDIVLVDQDEYDAWHNAQPSRWVNRHLYFDEVKNLRKADGRLEVRKGPLNDIGIQSV